MKFPGVRNPLVDAPTPKVLEELPADGTDGTLPITHNCCQTLEAMRNQQTRKQLQAAKHWEGNPEEGKCYPRINF
ncbi:hypothetical protein E2C01_032497 [Portunus trituberculatus]|uniref:Uncharacterized protein n=1 Tax=Portunus trituberculatus TaxID=210409 RepID=A0A5B7F168_PORTR|nr:hypothetical protein [Portunus trituberculatus]